NDISGFVIESQRSNHWPAVIFVGSIRSPLSTATRRFRNSRSASLREPFTVAVASLRVPVAGSVPRVYRNSQEPGERWRMWPVIAFLHCLGSALGPYVRDPGLGIRPGAYRRHGIGMTPPPLP